MTQCHHTHEELLLALLSSTDGWLCTGHNHLEHPEADVTIDFSWRTCRGPKGRTMRQNWLVHAGGVVIPVSRQIKRDVKRLSINLAQRETRAAAVHLLNGRERNTIERAS